MSEAAAAQLAEQRAKLNGAIDTLLGIAGTGDDLLTVPLRLVLAYLAVLERGSPTLAIKHRGSAVHITDQASVDRRPDIELAAAAGTAGAQARALAHALRADHNAADRIICGLPPADLLAFRTAAADLLGLADVRARQLLIWRKIGPEAP